MPVVDGGFGQGTGPIWLDDLSCSSFENRLFDCRHRAIGQHNCNHGRDAGVRCLPIETLGPSKSSLAYGKLISDKVWKYKYKNTSINEWYINVQITSIILIMFVTCRHHMQPWRYQVGRWQ